MNKQPSLFDYNFYDGRPPAQRHSITSQAAAASIQHKIGPLHREIMGWLKDHPEGGTDEEIQSALDMPANTQRPRRRELQLAGRIRDSGMVRLTRSGRNAVVWRLP